MNIRKRRLWVLFLSVVGTSLFLFNSYLIQTFHLNFSGNKTFFMLMSVIIIIMAIIIGLNLGKQLR